MFNASIFRRLKLIRPNRAVKLSPFPVLRGKIFSQPGYPTEDAYVKFLPSNLRAIEAVCAWIARETGAPAPEPVFVTVSKSFVPRSCVWPFKTDEGVCFATIEIPQAQPVRKIQSAAMSPIFSSWSKLVNAAVFDHLIANDDRSEDNLMLDGYGRLWLIDHSRALGGAGGNLFSDPFIPIKNIFLELLKTRTPAEKNRIRQELMASCMAASAAIERIPYSGLGVDEEMAEQIQRFLQRRERGLTAMLLSELGLPDLFQSIAQGTSNRDGDVSDVVPVQ